MSILSKLTANAALGAKAPIETLLIARTPAPVPDVQIDLERSFRAPPSFASVVSGGAEAAATLSIQSLSGPAPLPDIETPIPRDKPAPPDPTIHQRT